MCFKDKQNSVQWNLKRDSYSCICNARTEDPNLIPSTHVGWLTITYSPNSRRSQSLFWPSYMSVSVLMCTNSYMNICTQETKYALQHRDIKNNPTNSGMT